MVPKAAGPGAEAVVPVDGAKQALAHARDVKSLDEPEVRHPGLCGSVSLVLLKYRGQAPALQLPEAAHKATCPVLSVVAAPTMTGRQGKRKRQRSRGGGGSINMLWDDLKRKRWLL